MVHACVLQCPRRGADPAHTHTRTHMPPPHHQQPQRPLCRRAQRSALDQPCVATLWGGAAQAVRRRPSPAPTQTRFAECGVQCGGSDEHAAAVPRAPVAVMTSRIPMPRRAARQVPLALALMRAAAGEICGQSYGQHAKVYDRAHTWVCVRVCACERACAHARARTASCARSRAHAADTAATPAAAATAVRPCLSAHTHACVCVCARAHTPPAHAHTQPHACACARSRPPRKRTAHKLVAPQ